MGVKTRAKQQPEVAKDDNERGTTDASSSPPDDGNGRRKSLRIRKSTGDDSKEVANKKNDSEEKDKANAAGAKKGHTTNQGDEASEPMDTKETGKPSGKAKANGSPDDSTKKHQDKHHHHHHEHRLSEATLKRLKTYLQSEKMNDNLDEDAIAVKILRTDRATSERVRFLHDPYADSDEEEDTPDQSYQAAEEYTLALDFYKRTIAECQAERPNAPMDKKTLNWLRKALGLHRRNDLWETTGHEQNEETDDSEDEEGSQGKPSKSRRSVTRGMVRSTRIKRRAERQTKESINLNALASAVEDLEGEFGPFAESATGKVSFTMRKCVKSLIPNDAHIHDITSSGVAEETQEAGRHFR